MEFKKEISEIINQVSYCTISTDEAIEEIEKLYDKYRALQLQQTDVIYQLCDCGGNERVALDCTSKNCRHPKYNKK
jgi:hypothetical protein